MPPVPADRYWGYFQALPGKDRCGGRKGLTFAAPISSADLRRSGQHLVRHAYHGAGGGGICGGDDEDHSGRRRSSDPIRRDRCAFLTDCGPPADAGGPGFMQFFTLQTGEWTDTGRRCPAAEPRWSCPQTPAAGRSAEPPTRRRRRRCPPARPRNGLPPGPGRKRPRW